MVKLLSVLGAGTKMWEGIATGASNTSGLLNLGDLNVRLPQEQELVLLGRGVDSNVTSTSTMRMKEEW